MVTITKETIIGDILDIAPQTAPLFMAIGMHCLGCPASRGETVEEACMVHGIDPEELLEELKTAGFSRVRLAYQKANPQSTRFWTKNGFQPVEEKPHPYGTMLAAVRNLSFSENPC